MVGSNVTLSRENKTKKKSSKTDADGGHPHRQRGRAWWRGGDGGRRPDTGPGDSECQRVSHFCQRVSHFFSCLSLHQTGPRTSLTRFYLKVDESTSRVF